MTSSQAPVLVLRLSGHLTRDVLAARLAEVGVTAGAGLLVDCSGMTGYDAEARALFVEWHRERATTLRGVAVVTDKSLWHMIVSAMSLASRQKMRAFERADDALAWLAG